MAEDGSEHSRRAAADDRARRARAAAGDWTVAVGVSVAQGGYFDLHNFRNRYWKPAQLAAEVTPLRRVYDLRHTFATFALRAGISTFELSRYMGTSVGMIDRHYGHLARDGREHAIRLLDLFTGAEPDVHAVDAAWTSDKPLTSSLGNGKGG